MSDSDLLDAVAHGTGEDAHEIRRRGFMLTGPDDSGSNPEPESLLDVMLVDLPETGTVDWDSLGFGCREPFYTSTLKARKKQAARAFHAKRDRARHPASPQSPSPWRTRPSQWSPLAGDGEIDLSHDQGGQMLDQRVGGPLA